MQTMVKKPRQNATLARRAIADFVDTNIPRFNGWLNQVANGIPQVNRDGEPIKNDAGSTVYLVRPDPLAALKIVSEICEYHLPKLSRADVAVTGLVAHMDVDNLTPSDFAKMSLADLKAMALDRFAQQAATGTIIDVEATVVEPLPSWLEPLP